MRCAIYCRISEDRSGEALGVTRQLDDARRLATDRGWTVVAEHVDNDLSALRGGRRPGYEALLQQVAAGQLDRIVVWHTSRLWRNRRERAEGIEHLKAAHVSVTSVKGPELDLSSASGRMMAGILGEFDTAESELKGERVSAAARQRAEQGRNHGSRRAFGYTKNGMEIIPEEADALRHAARQLLAGVPLGSITREMNEKGLLTVRGHAWSPGTLKDSLRLPRHAGLAVWRGDVVGRGQWPPIFTEDMHHALVALLNDPTRRTSTGNRAAYLLSGIARCGVCGSPITAHGSKRSTPGGKPRGMYRCRPPVGQAGYCVGRRRDWIDKYVTDVIIERLSRPDARDLLVDDARPDTEALRDEAGALRVRLDALADAFAVGDIDRGQLQSGTQRIRARLTEIDGLLAHTSRAPILVDLVEAEDVRSVWETIGLDRQRAVVQTLIDVVILPGGGGHREFDPTKVQITWKA
ncbi:recombinase family protein [Actinoplanes sp. NPDC048791]|uniref:recombinase family protein n=1 Tax=Actinoplanes sp. NPDC048791 TaxID=3154623 RepID=UPI0033EC05B3